MARAAFTDWALPRLIYADAAAQWRVLPSQTSSPPTYYHPERPAAG